MSEIRIQTSVRCCGAMRTTPFCPQCGKGLVPESPLIVLLGHIAGQASRLQKKADSNIRRPDSGTTYEAAAAKWESWRVALSEVINPREDE